jgi:hypothetical protein
VEVCRNRIDHHQRAGAPVSTILCADARISGRGAAAARNLPSFGEAIVCRFARSKMSAARDVVVAP